MISKTARKKLKKVLGSSYSEDVALILKEKGIVNRLGNSHTTSYIIWVFNAERNNEDVENAIYELYSQKLKTIEKRESILTKKPEALTPGSY